MAMRSESCSTSSSSALVKPCAIARRSSSIAAPSAPRHLPCAEPTLSVVLRPSLKTSLEPNWAERNGGVASSVRRWRRRLIIA